MREGKESCEERYSKEKVFYQIAITVALLASAKI